MVHGMERSAVNSNSISRGVVVSGFVPVPLPMDGLRAHTSVYYQRQNSLLAVNEEIFGTGGTAHQYHLQIVWTEIAADKQRGRRCQTQKKSAVMS